MLLDRIVGPRAGGAVPPDIARLRLVCLVRSGDGYVLRAVGQQPGHGTDGAPPQPLDIAFGNVSDRARAAELDGVVRQVQRWCEDGTPVSLGEDADHLVLRAGDGTAVTLPRAA